MSIVKPKLMGILNLTPDSFSDGGRYDNVEQALRRAEQMLQQGADILDLGGESTRPGAKQVSLQEEMDRVLPVIEAIKRNMRVSVSVDTSNSKLMREAIALNVDVINDVRALARVDDLTFLVESSVSICLMHMQGQPESMQDGPSYENVLLNVKEFLLKRVKRCEDAGIETSRLWIDPGFGFGKSLEHNLMLLNRLQVFTELKYPVLVGTSRKTMVGNVLRKDVDERLYGSLATVAIAITKGAKIIRAHDISETRDVLDMTWATLNEGLS